MDSLIKTLREYKSWKNSLMSVLEKNIDDIADIIRDIGGENFLIPIKCVKFQPRAGSNPAYSFPTEQFISQPQNYSPENDNSQAQSFDNTDKESVIKGVAITTNYNTPEKLIWFMHNGKYFLINSEKNNSLNINQNIATPINCFPIYLQGYFVARFEEKIDFIVTIIEWLPTLEKILQDRKNKIDPKQAENLIGNFISAVK
jgi:hypothetical protein